MFRPQNEFGGHFLWLIFITSQVMFKDWFLCKERIGFSPRFEINSYIHWFPPSLSRWLCTFFVACHGTSGIQRCLRQFYV